MVELVERLFGAWNEHRIRYCHWKSTDHLDATMQGRTDIDVLVDARQANLAEVLAVRAGYERFETDVLRTYPGVLDYVGLDEEAGRWVHVHLHYQLVLGDRWVKATWLPLEESVLERASFDENYSSYVVDAHDELYMFCARMALKHWWPFSLKYVLREFEHIRGRIAASSVDSRDYPASLRTLARLVDYARTENAPSRRVLNKLAQKTARSLSVIGRYGRARFKVLSILRKMYRYWVEFRRRILKNFGVGRRKLPTGGKIVAFVGIDGSGKTSAVRRTEEFFAQQMNVTRVFLGSGQSGASWYRKLAFAIFGTRAKWKGHQAVRQNTEEHNKNKIPWYYALWVLLAVRDKKKNLRRAIAARANASLVVSDRWPQRQIHATFDGPRLSGREGLSGLAQYVADQEEEVIELSRIARPDLLLRLRVSGSEAYSRKPGEFDLTEAEKNARLLDDIQWEAKHVVDIDADLPIDEVDKQIRSAIWKVLRGVH